MKFTKLSLAALAAMSIASSAFAVENVKVDGQIKLWYQTADVSGVANSTLFDSASSTGDMAYNVGVSGELTKKVGFGIKLTGLTTLGLENNLVGGVQSGATTGGEANPYWLSEAFFTYKAGNTLAKIGRQALDTPLAYSEQWSAAANTFEAAVLINSDIKDTTLIGAYVSRGNGIGGTQSSFKSFLSDRSAAAVVNGGLGTPGASDSGAYMLAAINTSIPNLALAGFYYNVQDVATAAWLSAAYDAKVAKLELTYANVAAAGATKTALNGLALTDVTTDAYAAKLSGALAGVNLAASYSQVAAGALGVGNTATLGADALSLTALTTNTKLPTAGVGGSTTAGAAGFDDTTGYKVEAGYSVAGINLGAYYNSIAIGNKSIQGKLLTNSVAGFGANKTTLSSYAVTAATKVDDINLLVAYVAEDNDKAKSGLNDQNIVRVVASINF